MVVVVVFGGGGGVGLVQEHGQRAARRVDSIVSGLVFGVCLWIGLEEVSVLWLLE